MIGVAPSILSSMQNAPVLGHVGRAAAGWGLTNGPINAARAKPQNILRIFFLLSVKNSYPKTDRTLLDACERRK